VGLAQRRCGRDHHDDGAEHHHHHDGAHHHHHDGAGATTGPPSTPVRYEVENAAITAGMDPYDHYWCPCSNGRAVGDFAEAGESITWTVNAPKAGRGSLTWRYGAGGGAATRRLSVNGTPVGNVQFPRTNGGGNWRTVQVTVTLRAGSNTIRLAAPSGPARYVNVDYLDVTPPT
jgi:hypothetical protein